MGKARKKDLAVISTNENCLSEISIPSFLIFPTLKLNQILAALSVHPRRPDGGLPSHHHHLPQVELEDYLATITTSLR